MKTCKTMYSYECDICHKTWQFTDEDDNDQFLYNIGVPSFDEEFGETYLCTENREMCEECAQKYLKLITTGFGYIHFKSKEVMPPCKDIELNQDKQFEIIRKPTYRPIDLDTL